MRTPPTLQRPSWLPGAAVLSGAAGLALAVGLAAGVRAWPLYVGLLVGFVFAVGWIEELWSRRRVPAPRRSRAKLKVIQGGKHDYDLADDDSTDSQRYLM
jgi:hypothetical protein